MSQQANDPAAKSPVGGPAVPAVSPAPSTSAPVRPNGQPAAPGGVKSMLKIAIPLVVLVAVVFGITYFSRYTQKDNDNNQNAGSVEPPLRFGSSMRQWIPFGTLQDQSFPGFYEARADAAGPKNAAAFWFENRNRGSVTMQKTWVSCTACSGARVAPIPPDVTRQLLQMTGIQALPQGLVSAMPMGMAVPAADLGEQLLPAGAWQQRTFRDEPQATFKVPAAANTDHWSSEQWGILELQFSVGAIKQDVLIAKFELQAEGGKTVPAEFRIAYEGVEAFDLSTKEIGLGDITEKAEPRKFEVLLYSSTRGPNGSGPGDLAAPLVSVELPGGATGDPGQFVTVGTPVRVPETEILEVMKAISEQQKKLVRVESAYRMTVTFNPQVGGKRIDLGPFERVVSITVPNTTLTKTIPVKGLVQGGVFLAENRKDIVLSDSYRDGTVDSFRLITKQPDAEVVLVKSECEPSFLREQYKGKDNVTLERLTPDPDRGYYRLKITVPPESKSGPWSGVVVLDLKGPNPQRMRIVVRGKGGS
jgi:hypothetical protein